MGIAERKEREKQEMRRKIIDAAFEMFVEVGYERTSIRAIADKIEYSPATIYLYYKDKDELLYEVQREAFDLLAKKFAPLEAIRDPFQRLEALGNSYLDFAIANPQYYDLMFILSAPMNVIKENMLWENGCDAYEFLLTTIADCMEKQCIRYQDANLGALQAWSMVHGLASIYLKNRFMVMDITPEQAAEGMRLAFREYLHQIRA
ncbi:MAG: TetR/AcrR family transcriptional regulator [Bacteroidota bacterium]